MNNLPKLNLIAAVCENMGIGHGGNLPWRLKSEMKYFSEKTTTTDEKGKKNAVVMGRKTWCSIPKKFRPLKDRINVVLSRDSSTLDGSHHIAKSFEDAITWLMSPPTCHTLDKIFIIGGESIYKYALESKYPVRIYLTSILKSFECDAYFPRLSDTEFTLAKCQDVPSGMHEEDGVTYKIEVFVRKEEILKRVKSYFRSIMVQERLNGLAILSINCDKAKLLDFSDEIAEFSQRKARKALLNVKKS